MSFVKALEPLESSADFINKSRFRESPTCVGKISKENAQLNAVLSNRLKEVIDARADALGITPSKFAAFIFRQWQEKDYPPISVFDKKTEPDVMRKLKEKWRAAEVKKQQTMEFGGTKDALFLSIKAYLSDPRIESAAVEKGQKKVLDELRKNTAEFFENLKEK